MENLIFPNKRFHHLHHFFPLSSLQLFYTPTLINSSPMRLNSRRNSQISILKNQTRTTRFTVNFHQAKYSFLRFKLKQISSPTVHRIKIVDKLDTVNFARANKRWLLDNLPTIYIIARFEYLFHNGKMKHVWRFHDARTSN